MCFDTESSACSDLERTVIKIGKSSNFSFSLLFTMQETIREIFSTSSLLFTGLNAARLTTACFISRAGVCSLKLFKITLGNFSWLGTLLSCLAMTRSMTGGDQARSWSPVVGRGHRASTRQLRWWLTSATWPDTCSCASTRYGRSRIWSKSGWSKKLATKSSFPSSGI